MKTQQDSGVKSSGFLKMFLFITEIEPFLPFLFVLREINRTKQFPQKVFVNSFKVIPLCSIWKGQWQSIGMGNPGKAQCVGIGKGHGGFTSACL